MRLLLIAFITLLLLVLLWRGFARGEGGGRERMSAPVYFHDELGPTRPFDISDPVYRSYDKPPDKMTPGERVQYIINTYFSLRTEDEDPEKVRAREDSYLRSLPLDGSCPDHYSSCPQWAANNECVINPEWMLKNCPGSCKSCKLTKEQRSNVTAIYNQRDPPNCVFHGASYPGTLPYLEDLYDYESGVLGRSLSARDGSLRALGF
jgi:hypothetical protein